jgi:predicted nucleotidyltransferase
MFDVHKARASLERRANARAQANRVRHEQASRDAAAIIEAIVRDYRPLRIWQWGSVLSPATFGPRSDIDLAVEGITDAETFFRLLGEAMRLTRFHVDVVQMERIEPEFADIIRMKGKVVYER